MNSHSEAHRYPLMKIAMMIHFSTSVGPFAPESERTSRAYTKFVKQLLSEGMIDRPTPEERAANPGWAYEATEKGFVYVNALRDVKLPVAGMTWTSWTVPA